MKREMDELRESRRKRAALEVIEDGIIGMLPDDLPITPSISNVRAEQRSFDNPAAFLSFSAPSYDPDRKWNPIAVLQSLERAGWKQSPAALCRWDDYRKSPDPGLCESIPDKKPGCFGSTYKLTDVQPIAPVWFVPCQHTNCDAQLYMTAPDGRLFKVYVDVPHIVSIHAKRNEYRGGWSYERGSASLTFPQRWHSHPQCGIHQDTRAWVDTEQGISGAVYFAPHGEQSSWPLTASEFLQSLLSE